MQNKTALIVGLIFWIGPLLLLPRTLNEQVVEVNGKSIDVTIIKITANRYFKFEFEGKVYSKRIGNLFSKEHKIGETIKMKHLAEYDDIFLFPQEPVWPELIATGLLSGFGLWVLLKYWYFPFKTRYIKRKRQQLPAPR